MVSMAGLAARKSETVSVIGADTRFHLPADIQRAAVAVPVSVAVAVMSDPVPVESLFTRIPVSEVLLLESVSLTVKQVAGAKVSDPPLAIVRLSIVAALTANGLTRVKLPLLTTQKVPELPIILAPVLVIDGDFKPEIAIPPCA